MARRIVLCATVKFKILVRFRVYVPGISVPFENKTFSVNYVTIHFECDTSLRNNKHFQTELKSTVRSTALMTAN